MEIFTQRLDSNAGCDGSLPEVDKTESGFHCKAAYWRQQCLAPRHEMDIKPRIGSPKCFSAR